MSPPGPAATIGSPTTERVSIVKARKEWLVPAGLVLLSLIPVVAGSLRVTELSGGPAAIPAEARFTADPVPVVLHIVGASVYCVLGAFQFHAGLRRRRIGWHRAAGRLLVPCGLLAALTGLWMAAFYPRPAGDDVAVTWLRFLFGTAMTASILLAFAAVRRRDIAHHRAWMIRGYAIGLGAGTQAFTHASWVVAVGPAAGAGRTVAMAAGWLINLAVAEWAIRRGGLAPKYGRRPEPSAGAVRA